MDDLREVKDLFRRIGLALWSAFVLSLTTLAIAEKLDAIGLATATGLYFLAVFPLTGPKP